MTRQTLSDILFWTLAAVSAALFVVLVLVVAGAIPIDSPSEPAATPPEKVPGQASAPSTEQGSTEGARTAHPANTEKTTTAPAAPAPTLVVVTASRGDSWISARMGSENGRVLEERLLAQGESARFRGTRIWLSIGAAGNVDVTVDGEPRALSPGTVSVVLTRSRTAATNS